MATAISKNARAGTGAQKLICKCGGEIKMFNVFKGGKMRPIARCQKCNKEARKPKDLF